MEEKKQSINAVKMVVLVAIGAALYGLGGMIGIPIFANTTFKPAMAILALFAGAWGPVVGFLVGFLGHGITDLFMGWGVWPTWMLGSGLVGIGIGLYPKLTNHSFDEGIFSTKNFVTFVILAFISNFLGYLISAILDYLIFTEPLNKVMTQQILVAISNTLCIAVIGGPLMKLVANRNKTNSQILD